MWQVTHSCFGFIRYFIRTLTTSLDYFTAPAFVCLNKPDHLIHCICPESEVVTYTIVCCKRQAASNPIGLNLHLDFARLSYILFPLKTYLAILQVLDCASHIYLHIQLYRILPGIRPITSLTPNVPWSLQEPSSRCHSAGRHCRQALTEAKKVPKFTSRDSFQLKQL